MIRRAAVCVLLLGSLGCALAAQQKKETPTPEQTVEKSATLPAATAKPGEEQKPAAPVVTHHEIHVGGRVLSYTATAGMMPIRNPENDQIEANIFFIAYTLDNAGRNRPLMFSFNGGPGSASVWLHLGAIGPKRVKMQPDGSMPPPPFELIDNQQTWLNQTDLVFIDPVGTGFSRTTKKEYDKNFLGLTGDIASVGEFIRLYLGRYERWTSPLFLVGESYGTTRAAGLSGYLVDKGIALNGIVLVSSVLNLQTIVFTQGNDLPYVLFLPGYTAVAWYHKKLPADLQQRDLASLLHDAEQYAQGQYASDLMLGDNLSAEERQSVVAQLSRFTGLDRNVIEENHLRIRQSVFSRQLLRAQDLVVGRLDGRLTSHPVVAGEAGDSYADPTLANVMPPFTSTFNQYVRTELGYKTDVDYHVLEPLQWNWGSAGQGFPDTTEALRQAFIKNPYMKLFVGSGYFDLATPFFATQYTLGHLQLDPQQRARITQGYYNAGHMMYIESESLDRLKHDVSGFLGSALK